MLIPMVRSPVGMSKVGGQSNCMPKASMYEIIFGIYFDATVDIYTSRERPSAVMAAHTITMDGAWWPTEVQSYKLSADLFGK